LRFHADAPFPRSRSQQEHARMSDVYTPPEVWDYDPANGGQFAGINRRPRARARSTSCPVGEHPFQLYSLGTPNGVKATIMLEELLEAGFYERRVRRVDDQDLRREPVLVGVRRHQPQFEDPALSTARAPSRSACSRAGDPRPPRREVRLPAAQGQPARARPFAG
jgi:hypothetical protein